MYSNYSHSITYLTFVNINILHNFSQSSLSAEMSHIRAGLVFLTSELQLRVRSYEFRFEARSTAQLITESVDVVFKMLESDRM